MRHVQRHGMLQDDLSTRSKPDRDCNNVKYVSCKSKQLAAALWDPIN